MNVLIGCEFSGTVRDAFRAKGHNAWSCDVVPSETSEGGYHLEGDVLWWLADEKIKQWKWDMLIAHPPCTRLCNSGVRWLHERDLWQDMKKAALFFKALLETDLPKVCIENPIMHKHAVEIIGRRQDQIIQPWQFGHGETKATGLWLKNLPKLKPTNIVEGRENRIHKMSPSKDRGKLRSITYKGIAEAMADQWG